MQPDTIEEMRAELDRFQRDIAYCEEHYQELLERYPEQWIGILDQQVVGVGPDFDQMLAQLRERGVPLGRVLTRHLTNDEVDLILAAVP